MDDFFENIKSKIEGNLPAFIVILAGAIFLFISYVVVDTPEAPKQNQTRGVGGKAKKNQNELKNINKFIK